MIEKIIERFEARNVLKIVDNDSIALSLREVIEIIKEVADENEGCDLCNDIKILTVRCYIDNGNQRWRDLPKFCPNCGKELSK